MTQQYSTPDGSVWVESVQEPGHFTRLTGQGADMDFRAQKLVEVLRHFGPLSLHDPEALVRAVLIKVLHAVGWGTADVVQASTVISQLGRHGYKISKKEED